MKGNEPNASLPRSIALSGASNLRDLGGWPAADGRTVRFGRIFRSAALTDLEEDDRVKLTRLGIRTVCDLRGRREREAAPSRLPAGVSEHSLPIEPSVGAGLRDIVATHNATGENVMSVLRQAYVAYALDWSHRYRSIFDLLLSDGGTPLLFHCSAGKDRTGFGAALILTALGVPREAVREDFLASNRLWRGNAAIAAGLPPNVAAPLLRVHAEMLDAAFAAIEQSFHSFGRYAAVQLGLDAARLDALRARLLT